MGTKARLAVIGTGSIGRAIALGFVGAGRFDPDHITLTRRKTHLLADLAGQGFQTQSDNRDAVKRADIVFVAVEPQQIDGVLEEIAADLDPRRHLLVSIVSGASIGAILKRIGKDLPVARAMPNTGTALACSMTCVATMQSKDWPAGIASHPPT